MKALSARILAFRHGTCRVPARQETKPHCPRDAHVPSLLPRSLEWPAVGPMTDELSAPRTSDLPESRDASLRTYPVPFIMDGGAVKGVPLGPRDRAATCCAS